MVRTCSRRLRCVFDAGVVARAQRDLDDALQGPLLALGKGVLLGRLLEVAAGRQQVAVLEQRLGQQQGGVVEGPALRVALDDVEAQGGRRSVVLDGEQLLGLDHPAVGGVGVGRVGFAEARAQSPGPLFQLAQLAMGVLDGPGLARPGHEKRR